MGNMKNIGVLTLCCVSMMMHNTVQGMKNINSDSTNAMVEYNSVHEIKRFKPDPNSYVEIKSTSPYWRKLPKINKEKVFNEERTISSNSVGHSFTVSSDLFLQALAKGKVFNERGSSGANFSEEWNKSEQLNVPLVHVVNTIEQKNIYMIDNKTGEKKIICKQCTFATNMPRSMQVHYDLHAIMKNNPKKFIYRCELCEYLTKRKKVMFNHKETHSIANNYVCPIDGCDESEKSQRNLKLHIKWDHPEVKKLTEVEKQPSAETKQQPNLVLNQICPVFDQNSQAIKGYFGYGKIK